MCVLSALVACNRVNPPQADTDATTSADVVAPDVPADNSQVLDVAVDAGSLTDTGALVDMGSAVDADGAVSMDSGPDASVSDVIDVPTDQVDVPAVDVSAIDVQTADVPMVDVPTADVPVSTAPASVTGTFVGAGVFAEGGGYRLQGILHWSAAVQGSGGGLVLSGRLW